MPTNLSDLRRAMDDADYDGNDLRVGQLTEYAEPIPFTTAPIARDDDRYPIERRLPGDERVDQFRVPAEPASSEWPFRGVRYGRPRAS
jgi:hypothetical protein